jgi:hypothetical protein
MLGIDKETSILEAATTYHQLGWRVLPLVDKRPVTRWTTDPPYTLATIEAMFSPPCNFNLGVALGKDSQMIAFDIDGIAGQKALAAVSQSESDQKAIYNTLAFLTPNMGLRLLYQYEPDIPSRSLRHEGKEAIRIMSDGTQTVMPPSNLEGKYYQWTNCKPLAKCPTLIIERLLSEQKGLPVQKDNQNVTTSKASAYRRACRYVQTCEPAITGQLGGTRTFKICVRLVQGFQLDYHDTMSIMMNYFNPRCQPEWTEAEMSRKVEEALTSDKGHRNML